jgi:hypothetical protein
MSLSAGELSLVDRLRTQAARREAMTRRALGYDTARMLERLMPHYFPQVYDPARYTQFLMRPRVAAPFASRNIVQSASVFSRATALALAYRDPNPALTAVQQMTSANVALTMASLRLDLPPAGALTLTRVWGSRDLFEGLARRLDLIASRPLAAQLATALSRQRESLLDAHARAFATAQLSRGFLGAGQSAAALLEANRRLVENALDLGDALRLHDLLRRSFGEAGLELTWEEVYGEGLREFVDWVRQPHDAAERDRRLLLVGVFVESVEAADAFRGGDVETGVAHTVLAMLLLREYWARRSRA